MDQDPRPPSEPVPTTPLARALGRDLDITIRIARDGRVYFHDIPVDMIAVARTLCPDDPDLRRREEAARRMLTQRENVEHPPQ